MYHLMNSIITCEIQFAENVTLHKRAFKLNPYDRTYKNFDASNAVDGLKSNLHWDGGQCAVSALGKKNRRLVGKPWQSPHHPPHHCVFQDK